MKKMKYIVLSLSLLFLLACTSTSIRKADSLTEKHSYIDALKILEQKMKPEKQIDRKILEKYRQVFSSGEEYYNSVLQDQYFGNQAQILRAKENKYLLQKRYFSLPQSVKQQINLPNPSLESLNQQRENLSSSYVAFANALSSESYQNRLQKYIALDKALYYSTKANASLQEKQEAASKNLEQNLNIRVQGSGDFALQNLLQSQLQASLSSEKFFKLSPLGTSNLFLQVQIQNYQFVEMPESFSTATEYVEQKVAVNKMENGQMVSKMETQKIPYQKIQYTQNQTLSYHLNYALYDKNQVLVFSGSIPVVLKNTRSWTQTIPLDIRYVFNIPKTEEKPNAMTKEQMQSKSIVPVLKEIQNKIQTLKNI